MTYDLPGAMNGTRISWQVSSDARREAFIVVAADTPLPQLDSAIAGWKHAAPSSSIPRRGASRVVAAPIQAETSNASLRAVLAELDPAHVNRHVRHWEFSFPHVAH